MTRTKIISAVICIAIGAHLLLFLFVASLRYSIPHADPMPPFWIELHSVDHSWLQATLLGVDFVAMGIAILNSEDRK